MPATAGTATRLPPPSAAAAILKSAAFGRLVARPWFDRLALWTVSGPVLRLSRAWAAASVAEGSLDRFRHEVPLAGIAPSSQRWLLRALHRVDVLKRRYQEAVAAWEEAFFGEREADAVSLAARERARRSASQAYMFGRLAFFRWPLYPALPAVRYEIPRREAVEARFGTLLREPAAAYLPPAGLPAVAESRRVSGPFGREYWLRFESPHAAIGDLAMAHVFEPEEGTDPPTLVYSHGLGVELESYEGIYDGTVELVRRGVRLVRLDSPWHGWRRKPGFYGGEPFLATQPMGALDLFAAQVRELALLIDWCRRTSRGRVAIGGVSLGALVSQLAVVHSRHWPERLRPDALYLVTTSDDVTGLLFTSSLARSLGLPGALRAAGWSPAELMRWRPVVDPTGPLPVRPENIVMLLGRADTVTPFADGLAMAQRWRIPPENLFIRDQGHFSADLGVISDPAPLDRLAARLHG